jgi:hypothetical protein
MNVRLRRNVKRILIGTGLILVAVLFIGAVALIVPIEYRTGTWRSLPQLDHRLIPHVSAVFAAAFGAFFGSLSAFYLGRLQQQKDRRQKQHGALIGTQYALMSQWNIVEAIRVQHLAYLRNDPVRFTKMKLFWFPLAPTFVPFADLTFVLETKDPNLLHEIQLAEQNYRACAQALQIRNQELQKFYENPRVSHHIRDFKTGERVSRAADRDLIFLRQSTDGLYIAVDRALPRLIAVIEKLEKLIKSMFPGKTALKLTPIEEP